LRFFLIAVVFLIFDVEIVLLLPIPLVLNEYGGGELFGVLIYFLLVLLLGLFYE
jgi:NADH-ubiquinone oxidoreductase chain 3